jgi:hypothetical protein
MNALIAINFQNRRQPFAHRDYGRVARDTIRIIKTARYVPYWNGRSDRKSRPAREGDRAAPPY